MTSKAYTHALKTQLTILIGGHGSGKSEFAIEWARRIIANGNSPVMLVDLDTIKPMFRAQEAAKKLAKEGIEVEISSVPASDIPSISSRMVGMIGDEDNWMVVDVGGDAIGARILRSIRAYMRGRDHNLFYIINTSRPFNTDAASAMRELNRIESVSGLKVSGIISNTHMLDETTPEMIENGIRISRKIANELGIDLIGFMVTDDFAEKINAPDDIEMFKIHRMLKPPWLRDY